MDDPLREDTELREALTSLLESLAVVQAALASLLKPEGNLRQETECGDKIIAAAEAYRTALQQTEDAVEQTRLYAGYSCFGYYWV